MRNCGLYHSDAMSAAHGITTAMGALLWRVSTMDFTMLKLEDSEMASYTPANSVSGCWSEATISLAADADL